jgi:type I restriction enzyme S subunit
MVPLGDVLTRSSEWIPIHADQSYREVTVRLWGKGVTLRRECTGSEIKSDRRLRVRPNQFIASRIDARNGAFGLIPAELDGAVVTNDFPVFTPHDQQLLPQYLGWMSRTRSFVEMCIAASEGTTNRVRLKEDRFLAMAVPLPPLSEQRRIVARIEALADKIDEARATALGVEGDCAAMLSSLFRQLANDAPRRPLGEVARLTRRPAVVDPAATYPQVSVRSFGRGSFHSGVLEGSAITWEKPHLVLAGDILVSNIKAWEGAIAVASPDDHGRYGSHRYLTFQPVKGIALAEWVCHYLLSPEGLHYVGEASPGSADRNRTTSARAMCAIEVPLPSAEKQAVFAAAKAKTAALKRLQAESTAELDALLPSILDRAFRGEL